MLARSYAELKRYQEAVRAYAQLVKLVPDDAQIWANYADVQAMSNNESLLGEPTKLLNRALALDSNNTQALALSGSAAMERGDYVSAKKHWSKLIEVLPQDNPELPMIRDGIKQASDFLDMQKGGLAKLHGNKSAEAAVSYPVILSGKVSLSPALAGKVQPEDTVFIVARGPQSKMPIAAMRKQVKDLPLQFSFDDSMSMQTKLSSAEQITVVARVSKSGSPMSQPGDLQGTSALVKPGAKDLTIVIDTVQ